MNNWCSWISKENDYKSVLRLPWWLSGKESTCQRRRPGFNPWSEKIPHSMQQPSQCATTTEPVLQSPGITTTEPSRHNYQSLCTLEPMLCKKRSQFNEKSGHWNQSPHSNEDPVQPIKKKKKKSALKRCTLVLGYHMAQGLIPGEKGKRISKEMPIR